MSPLSTTSVASPPASATRLADQSEVARHWIGGEWASSDAVSESINPATGELLGRWADGGEPEARAAIAAARRVFDGSPWSRDRNLRHQALSEMADRFDAHAEELGTLVTKENGKKLAEGMFESTTAGATLRHAAAQALIDITRRVTREIQAGTIWTKTWAALNDGFAEGGYKQSGIGRLRGPLAVTEFQEAKTVVHSISPFQTQGD
jgi:acyl-CoA reductase-like NAD-dependent aldehyde dehydrogenase